MNRQAWNSMHDQFMVYVSLPYRFKDDTRHSQRPVSKLNIGRIKIGFIRINKGRRNRKWDLSSFPRSFSLSPAPRFALSVILSSFSGIKHRFFDDIIKVVIYETLFISERYKQGESMQNDDDGKMLNLRFNECLSTLFILLYKADGFVHNDLHGILLL